MAPKKSPTSQLCTKISAVHLSTPTNRNPKDSPVVFASRLFPFLGMQVTRSKCKKILSRPLRPELRGQLLKVSKFKYAPKRLMSDPVPRKVISGRSGKT